jgi:hypothetical protein
MLHFHSPSLLFLSVVNVARKGQVYLSQVLKDISKQSALVCSASLSNMYERSKRKRKWEQNPTNDEIKTKTMYQRNKREKRNRRVTGREKEIWQFVLCCSFLFYSQVVLKTQSLKGTPIRWQCTVPPPGMWRRVVWYMVTVISKKLLPFTFRVADFAGRLHPVQGTEKAWIGLGDAELTTDGGSNTEVDWKWTARVICQ